MKRLPPLFTIPQAGPLAASVASAWGLPRPVTCALWFAGINAIYRVESPRATYFLRIPRRGLGARANPAVEGALIAHLRERGCAVAAPVRTRLGGFTVPLRLPEGRADAVLFERIDGEENWRPDPAQAGVAGRTLARMHVAADGFRAAGRFHILDSRWLVRDSIALLGRVGLAADAMRGFRDAARRIHRRLARLPRTSPGWGILHGDAIPTNVRFAGTPPAAAWYDFEFCGIGWRAHDIASFRHFQLYANWDDAGARAVWRAFLRGYSSVRPIASWERRAIPVLTASRQLWIAGLHAWFCGQYGHKYFGPAVLAQRLGLLRKLVSSL